MDLLDIKAKICGLGPGEFQNMCNEILYRKGYRNINQLGSHTTSNKTTKGTPDTFFVHKGKYIAVEYTTQSNNLTEKIIEDINKCIKVFKDARVDIKNTKIIYFHTSSNIKLEEYRKIEQKCKDTGTKIKIYSIDEIAYQLKYEYATIAKDYLKIEIDTLQILEIEDFIKQYNANKLTVKINDKLLYREEELNKSISTINDNDYILVGGPAGTGKTHFCMELCKRYKLIYKNIKVMCIRNNNLQLYEDLTKYFKEDEEYLIFIDDANMLTNITQFLDFIKIRQFAKLKVIMTVRDYAKNKVLKTLRNYSIIPKSIELKPLTEKQIKEILKSELKINNLEYLEQIQKISLNNPRIAMMAGHVAIEKGYKEIISGEQLYDNYFRNIIDRLMIQNENKIIKSAGLIAFLNRVNKEDKNFCKILEGLSISIDEFWDAMHILNNIEFVDVLNDKLVKISEQCLANYLLYLVFIKNKYISIKSMIEVTFNILQERMIESLNVLTNIFCSKKTIDIIESSIKELWMDIKSGKNKDIDKQKFIDVFLVVIPTEALESISDRINQENDENTILNISQIREIKNIRNYSIKNVELTRLMGFRNTEDFRMALQLLFVFFEKKPSLIKDIYFCIEKYISFRVEDIRNEYVTQTIYIDEFMRKYEKTKSNKNLIILGLITLPIFLKTSGDYMESIDMRSNALYNYTLVEDSRLRKIRNEVFEFLLEIYDNYEFCRVEVDNIFSNLYTYKYKDKVQKEIMQNDLPYIEKLCKKIEKDNFFEVVVANKIVEKLKQNKLSIDLSKEIINNKTYTLFKVLETKNKDYNGKIMQKEVKKLIKNASPKKVREIFEDIGIIINANEKFIYNIRYGINALFLEIFNSRQNDNKENIQEFIDIGAPIDIDFPKAITILYKKYDFNGLYRYISKSKIKNKFCWKVACFSEIPEDYINQCVLDKWYKLISTKIKLPIARSIDLHFLRKYRSIDDNVFINTFEIINKIYNNKNTIRTFTSLLFWEHSIENAEFLINSFINNISLLIDIYIEMYMDERCFDYKGLYFNKILDVDKEKLLDKYIEFRINNNGYYDNQDEPIKHIWNKDNYDEIIKLFISKINNITEKYKRKYLFEGIFTENDYADKQDKWIEHYIEKNNTDIEKMKEIFNIISEFSEDRRLKFIIILIRLNSDFNIFDNISLFSSRMTWSGSKIPIIDKRIKFYERILENLTELKYIKHKIKIESKIEELRKYKDYIKEKEFLDIYLD